MARSAPTDSKPTSTADKSPAAAGDAVAGASLHGLPPLMAHSTAAAVAASAVGLGLANQMAGAWFGMMRGAFEASLGMAEALGVAQDYVEPDMPVAAPVARAETVAKVEPAVEKPVAKPVAKIVVASTTKPSKPKTAGQAAAAPAKVKLRSTAGDDLKRIVGIGPKLETLLKAKGIHRFADLVALGEAGLAALDSELKLDGRSARDGWLKAAQDLAPAKRKN